MNDLFAYLMISMMEKVIKSREKERERYRRIFETFVTTSASEAGLAAESTPTHITRLPVPTSVEVRKNK